MINIETPHIVPPQRHYLPQDFQLKNWEDIKSYYEELQSRPINSVADFKEWIKNRDELEAFISEDAAWRYIRYTRNTEDAAIKEQYLYFINQIKPQLSPYSNELDKKLVESPYRSELKDEAYKIFLRSTLKDIELYREENIPLIVKADEWAQEYAQIQAQMTIVYQGEELTLQQAAKYLKSSDRQVRRDVYDLVTERRSQDFQKLDDLFDELVKLRHQIALNAGFKNYRDYKFKALGRFDYTVEDVFRFHESVKEEIPPINAIILEHHRKKLGLDELKPYDLDAEPEGQEALKPYSSSDELVDKSISVFGKLHPVLGEYIRIMDEKGYLDLDSRKGKAPGGYNYPLDETGIPFIFMNASGKFRDMVTMMHEGGHAVHSFLSHNLELSSFKHAPSEVSELASMSMELLSMTGWETFFADKTDLIRAQREQLEGIIDTLPWIACIDKFQNWIYTNPQHTAEERSTEWVKIYNEFHPDIVDWGGYEENKAKAWQKQLHIFEVPFYYIEYGIAQLGALAVWKNYKENPEKGLEHYVEALKLGYTRSVPEIYEAAGISFNFSLQYIKELAEFIKNELELLEKAVSETV